LRGGRSHFLLDSGQSPAAATIYRLNKMPVFSKRLRHGASLFTDQAVETHSSHILVTILNDVDELGVKLNNVGALPRLPIVR